MRNGGCTELFKNVNEGIESLLVAKRLTSEVVMSLSDFRDLNKRTSHLDLIKVAKDYNNNMMSRVHKRVQDCELGLKTPGCLNPNAD